MNVVESFNFKKVQIFHRSSDNASDKSSTESVIFEYLNAANLNQEDNLMLVQVTSPFTTNKNFNESLDLFLNGDYDSVLSCARVKRFFWNEQGKPINYDFNKRPRRQEFKGSLIENGALYISKVKNILKHQNRISGNMEFILCLNIPLLKLMKKKTG